MHSEQSIGWELVHFSQFKLQEMQDLVSAIEVSPIGQVELQIPVISSLKKPNRHLSQVEEFEQDSQFDGQLSQVLSCKFGKYVIGQLLVHNLVI